MTSDRSDVLSEGDSPEVRKLAEELTGEPLVRWARPKPGDLIGGHPDPAIRRAERGVVRGLAAEFGKGQQTQWTGPDHIEIGVAGVVVTIRRDEPSVITAKED